MNTPTTQWPAIQWPIARLKELRFQHLSFIGGLTLAIGAAASMGAFEASGVQPESFGTNRVPRSSAADALQWAVFNYVTLHLIESDTVVAPEFAAMTRPDSYRIVETPEDRQRLEEELTTMFENGVQYGVVDLR